MNLRLCATRIRLRFRGYRYAIRRLACAIGYGDKGASPLVTIANTHRLLEQGGDASSNVAAYAIVIIPRPRV